MIDRSDLQINMDILPQGWLQVGNNAHVIIFLIFYFTIN